MVLDGSKEASLPSCGDKPSLALQQRVTHSIAQWRIFWVGLVSKESKGLFVNFRGFSLPSPGCLGQQIKCTPSSFMAFYIPSYFGLLSIKVSVQGFARWMCGTLSI